MIEVEKEHEGYGNLYLRSVDNVPSVIAISGLLTRKFCPANGIKPSAKRVAKPATLNDSTAPCVNGYLA